MMQICGTCGFIPRAKLCRSGGLPKIGGLTMTSFLVFLVFYSLSVVAIVASFLIREHIAIRELDREIKRLNSEADRFLDDLEAKK
jgi:uncharacterized membrane protein YciS (DUF1049 family)